MPDTETFPLFGTGSYWYLHVKIIVQHFLMEGRNQTDGWMDGKQTYIIVPFSFAGKENVWKSVKNSK